MHTPTPTYLSIVGVKDHHSTRARVHSTGDIMILHAEPHTTTLTSTQTLVSNILTIAKTQTVLKPSVGCNSGSQNEIINGKGHV